MERTEEYIEKEIQKISDKINNKEICWFFLVE